jgi:uncharacterized protein
MSRRETIGLIVFFLIAFGIPWAGWTFLNDEVLSLWLFPLFCSIAGFAATYAEGGTDGLRKFCQRTLRESDAMKWILLAALIPLALGFLYLVGAGVSLSSLQFPIEAIFGLWLVAALVTGPLAEEFGWRGYLQSKLLGYMRPIWVALALGVIWCIWHIPLYYSSVFSSPLSALRFLAYMVTWSIFILYLVQRANGSVWPAVIFHWAANSHANILRMLLPSVDGSQLPGGSKGTLLYLGVAVTFVIIQWRFFTTRLTTGDKPTETSNYAIKGTSA